MTDHNLRIPYVIDNIETRLADVLNELLRRQNGQQLDVATAYFSIRGFEKVRTTLPNLRRFRLLKRVLAQLGVEDARVRLEWISASEGDRVQHVINEMTGQLRALGPFNGARS